MSSKTMEEVTGPIAKYYSSFSLATYAAFSSYPPTQTAVFFSLASIKKSLLTFLYQFFSDTNGADCLPILKSFFLFLGHLIQFCISWKTGKLLPPKPLFCNFPLPISRLHRLWPRKHFVVRQLYALPLVPVVTLITLTKNLLLTLH